MYKLVISDDDGKTTVVPLVRDEITIGRKEGNTIRLTERNVSRRHARLRRENGAFVIEDLGSYNGVKINGSRIEGEVTLEAGDRVVIGDYGLAVQDEGAEQPVDLPSESVPISFGDFAEPTPPARLVMLTAPAPGAEYALTGEVLRIGRSEDLDIWVNHRSISREHASFVRTGEAFTVRDLESANGVRLNGTDIAEAELLSGDLLELGQVRFRFVGEGEAYVFDAEDAHAADAMLAESEASRAPVMAGVVIILLAIAAGAAIAMTGSDEPSAPPEVTEVSDAVLPPNAPSLGPSPEARARLAEAVRSCQAALSQGRQDDAMRFAGEALAVDRQDEAATTCRDEAAQMAREQETFRRALVALEADDIDGAFFGFEELSLESPLREHEAVARATEAFIDRHLNIAKRALPREPAEAFRHANIVLSTPGLTERQERQATGIVAAARRRGVRDTTEQPPAPEPPAPEPPAPEPPSAQAPEPVAPPAPAARETSARRSPTASREPSAMSRTPRPLEPAAAPEPEPPSALDQARACQGDHRCVIQALEGRTANAAALGMLIESHLGVNDLRSAIRGMRTFVSRYPSDRRATGYQTFLDSLQSASP